MQIIENEKKYDVVIVGSGAGGGMATKILADAGLKVAVVEAGPFLIQQIQPNRHNSNGLMNPLEEVLVQHVLLENLIWLMEDGKLKENPILKWEIQNSIGFAQECLEEEPTTGEEFPCVLGLGILKGKIGTD